MFLYGIIIIFASLIYLLVTNNEKNTLYIFASSSIAFLVLGYGVALNEINLLLEKSNFIGDLISLTVVIITLNLIAKFEKTIFIKDYNLVLRSFFFRFETLTLALYLVGILISTGNLLIDFLIQIALVRLLNIDKFIGFVVVNAVLFTNALFIYPSANLEMINTGVDATNLMHTNEMLVVIIIPVLMLILYFAGFSVRNLEKDIKLEFRIIFIIIITALIGILGIANFTSGELLSYMAIVALVLLYLNDMNVRKKFSRFSEYSLAKSIVIFLLFIFAIYLSQFSFLIFIIMALLINSVVLNENYLEQNIGIDEYPNSNKTAIITLILIFSMIILANYSFYNATSLGDPYLKGAIANSVANDSNILSRTYMLYANANYFSTYTATLIDPTLSLANIQYLIIAIPALLVITIPMQILILSATKYKTRNSGEIILGVISIGLICLTFISYAIGV